MFIVRFQLWAFRKYNFQGKLTDFAKLIWFWLFRVEKFRKFIKKASIRIRKRPNDLTRQANQKKPSENPSLPPVSSRWPLRHAVRVRSSSRLPTGGMFLLRWAMLSSRWPLWTRSASKALPACRACLSAVPRNLLKPLGTSSRDLRHPLHACRCPEVTFLRWSDSPSPSP